MFNTEIITVLNSIAAKYGYGKGIEPFTDDQWNAIGFAKEIINDYARLTAEKKKLEEENAQLEKYKRALSKVIKDRNVLAKEFYYMLEDEGQLHEDYYLGWAEKEIRELEE